MANERLLYKDVFGYIHTVYEIDGKRIGDKDVKNKLLNYEQEEADGKLLHLPCAVGSMVYITGEKYPCEITEVVIDRYGIHFNWVSYEKSYELTEAWNDGDFTVDDIGKTVFLTPEEAEKALEERENNA